MFNSDDKGIPVPPKPSRRDADNGIPPNPAFTHGEAPSQPYVSEHAQPAIAPGRHRVHKAVLVKWTLSFAFPLIIVGFFSGLDIFDTLFAAFMTDGESNPLGLVILGGLVLVLLLFGLAFLFSWFSYTRFTWEITETELHVYRGIVSKKQTHIPFARVHAVDSSAKIIDRILGIVTVNVQTAGSSEPEATIAGMKLADAEALRAEIFARKRAAARGRNQGAVSTAGLRSDLSFDQRSGSETSTSSPVVTQAGSFHAGALVQGVTDAANSVRGVFGGASFYDDEPVEFERRLSTKELFLVALSGKSLGVTLIAALAVAFQILGTFGINEERVMDVTLDAATAVQTAGGLAMVTFAAMIAFTCLVIWIVAIAGKMVSIGGFTVRRRGERLEVEQGLLQHRFNGISLSRVQSVVIRRGFIKRLFGYAEVVVSTVSRMNGSDNSKDNGAEAGVIIHPLIKYSAVPDFLAQALPDFEAVPEGLKKLPKVALHRSLFRHVFWPALTYVLLMAALKVFESSTLPGSLFFPFGLIAGVLLLIVTTLTGLYWYKHAGYVYDATMLVLQKGTFNIETMYVPRCKIQWMRSSSNPFQRRAGVETIKAVTAAGDSTVRNVLRDMGRSEAEDLIDWVRPKHKR